MTALVATSAASPFPRNASSTIQFFKFASLVQRLVAILSAIISTKLVNWWIKPWWVQLSVFPASIYVSISCVALYLIIYFHVNCQAYKDTGKPVAEEAVIHKIRITLTSRNVPSLEKGKTFYLLYLFLCFTTCMFFQCVLSWLVPLRTRTFAWRDQSACPPKLFASPLVRLLVVKDPRLGIGEFCWIWDKNL